MRFCLNTAIIQQKAHDMTQSIQEKPIGIFDSGVGGLTVTKALIELLPNENIIYFGDTAHHPYGDKSAAAIQSYAIKIADMFLKKECKVILIACNTAASVAHDLLKEYVGHKAIVLNVIDPLIHSLKDNFLFKKIGLIGTKQTVNCNVYQKKIDELNLDINLISYPTNLLASAIEEFGDHDVINHLLKVYLQHPTLQNIEALVLACTHYPIIKQKISTFYEDKITIIDSSEIVAAAVKTTLEKHHLLNPTGGQQKHFYISDFIDSFITRSKIFFDEDLKLEHYPLWD